ISLDEIRKEIFNLEKMSSVPEFWNNAKESQETTQKVSRLKSIVEQYEKLLTQYEDLQTLLDIAIEENDETVADELKNDYLNFKNNFENQQLQTLLRGEYDSKNAILTFHAGAGGTEAQDWVCMLLRMYTKWAEHRDYKVKTLDFLNGDEAGLKSVTVLVEGINAYGYLHGESGVHRLVRISPFDSSGRRHTTFASLEVMPEIDNDVAIVIKPDDLKIDTYRSSGAGGQHVNTTDSAVRITHIPTGVVCACQNERSQFQNKDMAMKMLLAKLIEIKQSKNLEKIEDIKGVQKEIAWGMQIRSYVFMPYTLVKDHRTKFENGNVNAVMDGDIDGFINAYLVAKSRNEL
ncbi:MAG: peptide chain release factor 2, partial [Oscillospiraceae bacterium]